MSSRVEQSIEVDVPVRTAYDQWTQFEEFPEFMEGVESVQQVDDTHLLWTAEIGGKRAGVEGRDHRADPGRAAWPGRPSTASDERRRRQPSNHQMRQPHQGDGPSSTSSRGNRWRSSAARSVGRPQVRPRRRRSSRAAGRTIRPASSARQPSVATGSARAPRPSAARRAASRGSKRPAPTSSTEAAPAATARRSDSSAGRPSSARRGSREQRVARADRRDRLELRRHGADSGAAARSSRTSAKQPRLGA